jgi:alpha-methylacyl-CoA racemase
MSEVRHHPHHQARGTFIDDGEVWQPAPAPRFSRTPGEVRSYAAKIGQHSEQILQDAGFSREQIAQLLESGAIVQHSA